jgi:hypothetical protein
MIDDPIVEEIRRIRDEYARRFNYDLDAMFRDIEQKQLQSGRTYVSFPPNRPDPRRKGPVAAPVQESVSCASERK